MATKKKTEEVEVAVTKTTAKKPAAKKPAAKKPAVKKEAPKAEPKVEEPKVEEPKVEEVKEEPVKVEEVKVEPVKVEAPKKAAKKAEPKKEEKASFDVIIASANGAYIFKGPGLDFPKGKILPKNSKETVLEVKGNWGKIGDNKWILLGNAVIKV